MRTLNICCVLVCRCVYVLRIKQITAHHCCINLFCAAVNELVDKFLAPRLIGTGAVLVGTGTEQEFIDAINKTVTDSSVAGCLQGGAGEFNRDCYDDHLPLFLLSPSIFSSFTLPLYKLHEWLKMYCTCLVLNICLFLLLEIS